MVAQHGHGDVPAEGGPSCDNAGCSSKHKLYKGDQPAEGGPSCAYLMQNYSHNLKFPTSGLLTYVAPVLQYWQP